DGQGMASMSLKGVALEQMGDRRQLLSSFDTMRRDLDARGSIGGLDAAQAQALNVLTSSKLLEALDLSKESEKVRARYGDGQPYKFQFDGAPAVNEQLLLPRPVVDAGAPGGAPAAT